MPNNRHLDPVPQRFPGTIGPTKSPPLPPRYTVQTPEPPRTGATIGYSIRKAIAHRATTWSKLKTPPMKPSAAQNRFVNSWKSVVRRGIGVNPAYRKSKRSKFITFAQAFAKSRTNFSCPSAEAYTSATARSSELEPNTRSTGVAVHFAFPVARSLPS